MRSCVQVGTRVSACVTELNRRGPLCPLPMPELWRVWRAWATEASLFILPPPLQPFCHLFLPHDNAALCPSLASLPGSTHQRSAS